MRRQPGRRQRTYAQGMVEFAIILPMLMMLVFGIFEGARLVYTYNTIHHAAQEAARVGVLHDTPNQGAVAARAVSAASPLAINADAVDVEVNSGSTSFGDRVLGDRLKVTVSYTFVPVTSIVFGSTAGLSLTGETEMMVE